MKSFSEICREFFSPDNYAICENLISQLKTIEDNGFLHPDDYAAFGCEFILNGMNVGTDCYHINELIEERFKYNGYSHSFRLIGHWDTFLFYSPNDFRGLIFDFSHLYSDGKIICYDGLHGPKNLTMVSDYTIERFLKDYGLSRLLSVSHWQVRWKRLGINWNN